MNYHKKVQVGGDLGAELERIWAAIRSNQIKTSPGQRINRTPNGTTISFGTESAEAISLPEQINKTGTILEVHPFAGDAPELGNRLKQMAVYMDIDYSGQLVLLPPLPEGASSHIFVHDGHRFPSALYDGTNDGASWGFNGQIGSLEIGKEYEVKKFGTSLAVSSHAIIATHSPSFWQTLTIKYFIKPGQLASIDWHQA